MIVGYYCVITNTQGQIIKRFYSNIDFEDVKQTSTILFYIPIIRWRKYILSLDDCEKIFFYLGQFLSSHLSLQKSLENLKTIPLSSFGKKTVSSLYKHVEEGREIDKFFYENELIDDKIILSTLVVAQKSGDWGRIFTQLSEFIVHKKDIKSKVVSILSYPLMVLITLVLFLTFILPQIITNVLPFIQENGGKVPMLANISIWFQENILVSLLVFIMPIVGIYIFRLQVLRSVFKIDIELEYFFYLFDFLLRQSIKTENCIEILKNENLFLSIDMKNIHESLLSGKSLSFIFNQTQRFPKFIISLIELSCETSKFIENIKNIHSILHKTHEKNIQKTISILPNILILIIGGLFVFLILGLFLPLYENAIHLVEGA